VKSRKRDKIGLFHFFSLYIIIIIIIIIGSTALGGPLSPLEVSLQYFFTGGVVNLTPNPQPGGPGYPFLSGSSPLTCLAWEALPVAYATASIALGII
jgi:hypothetical protein